MLTTNNLYDLTVSNPHTLRREIIESTVRTSLVVCPYHEYVLACLHVCSSAVGASLVSGSILLATEHTRGRSCNLRTGAVSRGDIVVFCYELGPA